MKWFILGLIFFVPYIKCENNKYDDQSSYSNETLHKMYKNGVKSGAIDPHSYSYSSFLSNEKNYKNIYQGYKANRPSEPLSYSQWMDVNHYGTIQGTGAPLNNAQKAKKNISSNKKKFVKAVRKGDILITGSGIGGFIGHAAIMSTDNYILEMPGGKGYEKGLVNNNRRISKSAWYDKHAKDWILVYRCRDSSVAKAAANWAHKNYWNAKGGEKKTIRINYLIDYYVYRKNPSYCSKLVLQSYYFGSGKKNVIKDLKFSKIIIPTAVPNFFNKRYALKKIGEY